MQTMHLFAGIGGGLLADLILGHTPIVAVEWESYACKVLRERAAEGWFPELHVWEGDVRLFDPSDYAGRVDCIHAGFPCQDISVAGKQAGVSEGTRSGLYREVLRIAGIVRPRYLFLENVAAILSNGLGTVLADLAAMGYDCRWLCIRASDVGAPHHRDRWFLLADSCCGRFSQSGEREIQLSRRTETVGASEILAYSKRSAADEQPKSSMQWRRQNEAKQTWMGSGNVADADYKRREEFDAPGISEIPGRNGWSANAGRREGWWTAEPGFCRVAHGVPDRVGQLKGYGNAQVPLQAAVAWRLLCGE